MATCKIYESGLLESITGNTLRPGGLKLTKQAIDFCGFEKAAALLDMGCGNGATVEYIVNDHGLECIGIDSSTALIEQGLKRNPGIRLMVGNCEKLPFAENLFDGVLAECSFSLMKEKKTVIDEIIRVLHPGGKLIISDIYLRNNEVPEFSRDMAIESCILNAFLLNELETVLREKGFRILFLEDYTNLLKELMATIIMECGSILSFWEMLAAKPLDCEQVWQETKAVKLGYFLLIAEKVPE